jgi:hypothetical protein
MGDEQIAQLIQEITPFKQFTECGITRADSSTTLREN